MPIPTKPGVSRFIRFDPEQTFNKDNVARFSAAVGIKQSVQDAAGQWHDVEPYRTRLVMFGPSAERAFDQFKAGDNFIAEGHERTYTQTVDGKEVERDQFRASRLGHDNNLTNYNVDRTPRERETPARDTTARTTTREAPSADAEPASADPVATVLAQREEQLAPRTRRCRGARPRRPGSRRPVTIPPTQARGGDQHGDCWSPPALIFCLARGGQP